MLRLSIVFLTSAIVTPMLTQQAHAQSDEGTIVWLQGLPSADSVTVLSSTLSPSDMAEPWGNTDSVFWSLSADPGQAPELLVIDVPLWTARPSLFRDDIYEAVALIQTAPLPADVLVVFADLDPTATVDDAAKTTAATRFERYFSTDLDSLALDVAVLLE